MFLPYTTEGCQKHGIHTAGTDSYHLMSSTCLATQVAGVLSLLNTESVAKWFGSHSTAESVVYYTPRYWKPVVAACAHGTYDPQNTGKVSLSYDDLYCHTCERYVSKALSPAHWDDLCSTCYRHSDECECCSSCGYNPCECCETCGSSPGWCECCSHCGGVECECEQCEDCGNSEYACSCSSSSLYGQTRKAPWIEREDAPMDVHLPTIAECQHRNIDPIQAAANFYLLDAIKSGIRANEVTGASDGWSNACQTLKKTDSLWSAITVSSDRSYRALVEYLAPNFLAYGLSAVGGELRYHKAVGNKELSSTREKAWDNFVEVVQVKGPSVLKDADMLFREFGGGAYGGEKWAQAAKVVGSFVGGTMPAWLFVDRVFTLQHNGGCFLNKVTWAKRNEKHWGLDKMLSLLNAHSGVDDGANVPTDWALLLQCATPEVRQMWEMSERAIRRLARRFGGTLPYFPRKRANRYAESTW